MKLAIVGAALCVSSIAAAEDRFELGANLIVPSESQDTSSGGHPGGAAALTSWFGQLAFSAEVGHHTWTWESGVSFVGVAAKAAFHDTTSCTRECGGFRAWLDVGIQRELWTFDQPDVMTTERSRWSKHVGIGVDVISRRSFIAGGTVFLRVQKGDATEPVFGTYREVVEPYDVNLVAGIGVLFGN